MREDNRTGPQDQETRSICVLEYLDWRRLRRVRDRRNPKPRLHLLEGHFSRNRFEFDYYTKGLEGQLVAFAGEQDRMPILALGLSCHLAHPEEHILYPVTHGSSCTGDLVTVLALHLRRGDLLPRYGGLPLSREEAYYGALLGVGIVPGRSRGPRERRVILAEEICHSERSQWPWGGGNEVAGLLVYPVLVLRIAEGI